MYKQLFEDVQIENDLLSEMLKAMGDYSMEEIIEASTKVPMMSTLVLNTLVNALQYMVQERERLMDERRYTTY
jgi:hypothetical protein